MSRLEDVYGVGDVRAARLRERGCESVEDLAAIPVDEIADLLDGVGRSRARKIRHSAKRVVAESAPDRSPPNRPDAAGECVIAEPVTGSDAVLVAPGRAFLTRAGTADSQGIPPRALVSVPGDGLADALTTGEPAAGLEETVVLCPPERAAAVAPPLYETPVEDPETDGDGAFLRSVLRPGTVIPGRTIRELREDHPGLGDELATVLRNGTVLRRGGSFALEDAEAAELVDAANVYVPGDRVFGEATVLDPGTRLAEAEFASMESFLAPGVATVPAARVFDAIDGTRSAVPPSLSHASGVLLPPGTVR